MDSNKQESGDVAEKLYGLILRNKAKVKRNFETYVNNKSNLNSTDKKNLLTTLMEIYFAAMKDVAEYFSAEDLNPIQSRKENFVDPELIKSNNKLEKEIEYLENKKKKLLAEREKKKIKEMEEQLRIPESTTDLLKKLNTIQNETNGLTESEARKIELQLNSVKCFTEKLDSIKDGMIISQKRKRTGYLTQSRSISPSRKRSYAAHIKTDEINA